MSTLRSELQSVDHPDFLRDLYGPEGSFERRLITGEPMSHNRKPSEEIQDETIQSIEALEINS